VPFSARESVAGLVLGSLANAAVIALGFAIPLGDPLRNRVDNALFLLGVIGALLALLLPRSGMVSRTPGSRAALGIYGTLSMLAVALADFGAMREVGWAVKAAAAGIWALALRGLARWA
jgi:hypothetical protein